MSLQLLHKSMHWPRPSEIFSPEGAGLRVLLQQAKDKIQRELGRQLQDESIAKVGLLTKAHNVNETIAPVAVVCEFTRIVSNEVLAIAHRLAWNFSRAPLLITIEPSFIRTWTCCEIPASSEDEVAELPALIREAGLEFADPDSASNLAAHALNWVRLANGDFYRQFPQRFKRDGRADQVLLEELSAVRKELANQDLPKDTIHDLLARIIFAQFLFDRKDSEGVAALNPGLLKRLNNEGVLKQLHSDLGSILADYEEAYRFFRWLNSMFNGDLFPGEGSSKKAQREEWRAERKIVNATHLKTLAEFVGGTLQLKNRQRLLWRQYSFDVIPLELISSIYEQFVSQKSAHYTPGFLVDFILDGVLPWNSDEWDLKVLDPACGSGIFLVKAYQRLIQRWKNAHPDEQPNSTVLRRLLEKNLFGVDIDEHAVRVASFSLYLTMCDEIDPKNYLRNTKFPRMRGERLIASDFFEEEIEGFGTASDAATYDLVLGNAPWGKNTASELSKRWAKKAENDWKVANKEVGSLFLPKAAALTKANGYVSMIQSASAILFNRSGPSTTFRKKLFSSFEVMEVVNLSALRFDLFKNAISPPCIVSLKVALPKNNSVTYVSPKQIRYPEAELGETNFAIVVNPSDISTLTQLEAIDGQAWATLAWGGRRDFYFINRLKQLPSLEKLKREKVAVTRRGVLRGDRKREQQTLANRRILETEDFPADMFLSLPADDLPLNTDLETDLRASTSMEAFEYPQMILKQGWTIKHGRFRASVIEPGSTEQGVLCSRIFITVHCDDESVLNSAVLSYNSTLCVYFMLLTSGRLASYRPEPLVEELMRVPICVNSEVHLDALDSYEEIDRACYDAFGIQEPEQALIEDLVEYTLADFKGDAMSAGRRLTQRIINPEVQPPQLEPEISKYCEFFISVLKAGFGEEIIVSAKIFQEPDATLLPVRLVAFYLEHKTDPSIQVEKIGSDELCFLLNELNDKYLRDENDSRGGIFFQRVARVYSRQEINGREVAIIYLVKPDRVQHWTRSAGMRDADEVAVDVQTWREQNSPVYNGVAE
jgi:hypothetical protein